MYFCVGACVYSGTHTCVSGVCVHALGEDVDERNGEGESVR